MFCPLFDRKREISLLTYQYRHFPDLPKMGAKKQQIFFRLTASCAAAGRRDIQFLWLFSVTNWELLFYTNIDGAHCKFSNAFHSVPFSSLKFNCIAYPRSNVTYYISFSAFNIRKYNICISSTSNFYLSANRLYLFAFHYLIRNFWKFAKNGRKKSSKSFSDLLLHVPLRGGGIFSFYVIGQAGT